MRKPYSPPTLTDLELNEELLTLIANSQGLSLGELRQQLKRSSLSHKAA